MARRGRPCRALPAMHIDWKTKMAQYAQVAARLESTGAPARRPVPPAVAVGRVARRPGTDWRLLTAAERQRRNEERAYERHLREKSRALVFERKRRAEETARREERRILREIAASERESARRARERAREARTAAITHEFMVKLARVAERMRLDAPPERTSDQRREDARWVTCYCEALRFEARRRNLPNHFERVGALAVARMAAVPTRPATVTALHIEDPYSEG